MEDTEEVGSRMYTLILVAALADSFACLRQVHELVASMVNFGAAPQLKF